MKYLFQSPFPANVPLIGRKASKYKCAHHLKLIEFQRFLAHLLLRRRAFRSLCEALHS